MHHFSKSLLVLLLSSTYPVAVIAQFEPVSAHANLYFPHLADGGGSAQQWLTSFTFINANLDPQSWS